MEVVDARKKGPGEDQVPTGRNWRKLVHFRTEQYLEGGEWHSKEVNA
jgi:hypothetical protein